MGPDDPLTKREEAFRTMLTQPRRLYEFARPLREAWMARRYTPEERAKLATLGLGIEQTWEERQAELEARRQGNGG